MSKSVVFVTGGTGYLGIPLIKKLLERGHVVLALARSQSLGKVPTDAIPIEGNALDAASFVGSISPAKTLIHLVGVPNPNPSKAKAFRAIDLVSVKASIEAAKQAGIEHFIYVSVAQPAPVMRQYIAVRQEGEALIQKSGINATFIRPWYILGPGHRWPYVLLPFYKLFELFPVTRIERASFGPGNT